MGKVYQVNTNKKKAGLMILMKQGRIQGRKHKQDREIDFIILKTLILKEVMIVMNNHCT